jgi:hypothetical protein
VRRAGSYRILVVFLRGPFVALGDKGREEYP